MIGHQKRMAVASIERCIPKCAISLLIASE